MDDHPAHETLVERRPLADGALPHPLTITAEQVDLIKKTVALGATAEELQLYFYDCRRRGVHPLDRMIHFTKRGGRYTPVTGIDFLRSRAASTGSHMGTDDAVFAPAEASPPVAATITVYRLVAGERCAFTATARWAEYCPREEKEGFMWRKMPATMLGKCAEALALRKAFPQELSGLYVTEELDQATGGRARPAPRALDPEPPAPPAPPSAPGPTSLPPQPDGPIRRITPAQARRLYAILNRTGVQRPTLEAKWGHIEEIAMSDYDTVCSWVESSGQTTP